MHPAFAETTTGSVRFYWNVSGIVGLNGVNKFDDVLFVQWCFFKMAKWPAAREIWPGLSRVNINGSCTGRADDPLVETIKLAEAQFGGNMDGRVTPISNSAKFTISGIKYPYLIMVMNIALSQMHPQQYPRLDLMPEFVWRIKDQVVFPFLF